MHKVWFARESKVRYSGFYDARVPGSSLCGRPPSDRQTLTILPLPFAGSYSIFIFIDI